MNLYKNRDLRHQRNQPPFLSDFLWKVPQKVPGKFPEIKLKLANLPKVRCPPLPVLISIPTEITHFCR